ncbi:MAG: OsmC family protein [Chitinophagaceae bacterium]|nr:OsmC family protein [Chitinophagaceae bacterium]MBL0056727.1 OsmC family protein [Chitinophagaceae bacterium]
MTASIIYQGHYRCECTHLQSGTVIETDAPTDNRGKGERFSPTDTVCVALATCVVTSMALKAGDMGIDLGGTRIAVTKHMLSDPRRIGKIEVSLSIPASAKADEKDRIILQRTGDHCPVAKSLHPDLQTLITYDWGS